MKITFLHHTYPGIGGTETVTNLLGAAFEAMGHQVTVMAWNKPADMDLAKARFTVVYLPDPTNINTPLNSEAIFRWATEQKVDCLINQGPFWVPSKRIKDSVTIVLSVLHYAPAYKIANQRQAIIETFRSRSKSLIHFCKSTVRFMFKDYYARRDFDRHFRSDLATIVENSDRFMVLTEGYMDELQILLGHQYDNLLAIANGLSVRYVPGLKEKTVVSIGRLTKWDKRVDRLLHIWKRVENIHPEWDLKILGDGPERQNLERLAKKLNLKRCRFEGFVDVESYLEKASILAMTSSSEGFPMVLLEAQARGVVPMAFDVSKGVEELIRDGNNGLLIAPGNCRRYAAELASLMADDSRRDSMGARAIKFAAQYDISAIAHKWIDIINLIKHEKSTANRNNSGI